MTKLILNDLKYDLKNTVFTLICTSLSSVLVSFIFTTSVIMARAEIKCAAYPAEAAAAVMMFAFIGAAVITAGCFMIRSAIDLSFSRKLKTLAVLSSVGANEKQKSAYLLAQAAIYSLFGAAVGTLSGAALADVFLSVLKNALPEFANRDYSGSVLCSALAFAACFAAVMIPSLKPAARLRKINVADAQRDLDKINIPLKDGVFTVVAEKLFGYTGRLAGQLYENDRKKYRAVTAAAAFGEGFLFFFRSFPEYERQTGGSPPSADTLRIIYLITLPVIVFAVGAALPSDLAALGMKKRSYTMLASVGAPRSRIYRIAVVESAYFAFNLTVFSTISAVIGSYAMLICERLSAPGSFRVFTLPLRAVPVCIAVNASVVLLFLICESVNVKCAYDGGITMNRE